MPDNPYLDWLIEGLKHPGRSQSGLARHMGKHPSIVNKIVKGGRRLSTEEVGQVAAYFGEAVPDVPEVVPSSSPLVTVRIAGKVEAGAFYEDDDDFDQTERRQLIVPRDERFPRAKVLVYEVSGDSMNALQPRPIYPGDVAICVRYQDIAHEAPLRDGMIVVVQRTRDGGHLRERSIKQIEIYADRIELHPRSTNPKHAPIVVSRDLQADDGTEVAILGIVRRTQNEMPI